MLRKVDYRIKEIIVTEAQIEEAAKKAATFINENYKEKMPILLAVLKGSIPFYSDIVRHVDIDFTMEFMRASSYKGGTKAAQEPIINFDSNEHGIENRDIIIIEDIIDSGKTMLQVVEYFKKMKARTVCVISLLNKSSQRIVDYQPDLYYFEVPNLFLVGYGLDYKGKLRNLRYIGVLKEEFIE